MKEINRFKFRAFEQKQKKMFYFTLEEIRKSLGFEYNLPDNLGPLWNDDFKCKFMQFTGLHDKNGKEIYEGDIVKWNQTGSNAEILSKVIFERGKFIAERISHKFGPEELNYINFQSQVIGNVYENKNLMENQ